MNNSRELNKDKNHGTSSETPSGTLYVAEDLNNKRVNYVSYAGNASEESADRDFVSCLRERTGEFVGSDEDLDDLQLKGLHIIQKKDGFRFGTDAVLLSYFTDLKNRENVIDLCTGSGIIPLLFAGKTESSDIRGLEIQHSYADMAQRSVELNNLSDRVMITEGDLKDMDLIKSLGKFSVVTANPPYKKYMTGIKNEREDLLTARHEYMMKLSDLTEASSILLKDGGRLCMIHRPERLLDIITAMRDVRIEPKRIRTVSPYHGKAPSMVLIEGIKYGKPNLKWESELVMYDGNRNPTEEIRRIYGEING